MRPCVTMNVSAKQKKTLTIMRHVKWIRHGIEGNSTTGLTRVTENFKLSVEVEQSQPDDGPTLLHASTLTPLAKTTLNEGRVVSPWEKRLFFNISPKTVYCG